MGSFGSRCCNKAGSAGAGVFSLPGLTREQGNILHGDYVGRTSFSLLAELPIGIQRTE